MTKEQIALIRDYNLQDDGTGKPIADVFSYIFNNELAYVNTRDFVITDDDNELIHAIKPNIEDPVNQARYPYKIMTGFYGNIQYMEALYNMTNFQKTIKEMFLDKGLIDQNQSDMIMNWANGIRNQACIPKAPGPYYKDTIMPVPKPPVPEVRHDGIFHGAPIDQITLTNKVHEIVKPLIETNFSGIKEKIHNHYELEVNDISNIPECFLAVIENFGEDLFMASVANMRFSAPYKMDIQKTKDKFISRCASLMPEKPGKTAILSFYIEAYNVRVMYQFKIKWIKEEQPEPEDPAEWINNTTKEINDIVDNIDYGTDTDFDRVGKTLNYTINDKVTIDEINNIINQISVIDGIKTITYNVGSTDLSYEIGSDISALNKFIEGVINSMPTTNNESINGRVAAVSATGASVVYTLKVKYYNQADCPAKIGDTYYNTVSEACAVGGVIELQKDVTEDINIPAGKTVEIKLNGKNITNTGDHTIVNNGNLTISGDGVIDNITNKKAAVVNNIGATLTIDGGTFKRSLEDGVNASTSGTNSYYTIDNKGTIIVNDGTFENNGGYSSLFENGWYDTAGMTGNEAANLTINGGTFTGGVNSIKNDELGVVEINNGTFSNTTQHSIMNWHKCTINNGTFTSTIRETILNGAYGMGIGKLEITGGRFTANDGIACVAPNSDYPSTDIIISGGNFSSNINSEYLKDNYTISKSESEPNRYEVVSTPVEEVVENTVDSFLEGLEYEGVIIEADPDTDNTYNIVTDNGSISECGLIDTVAAIEGVTSIVVSDGDNEVTYNADEDIAAFKAAVDNLIPKSNTSDVVTLTMTINT